MKVGFNFKSKRSNDKERNKRLLPFFHDSFSLSEQGMTLKFAYPELYWGTIKQNSRLVIKNQLNSGYPKKFQNFSHQLKSLKIFFILTYLDQLGSRKIELDIWIPQLKIALEYQGEAHYVDFHEELGEVHLNCTVTEILEKDKFVKKMEYSYCYSIWLDRKTESLASTLHQYCPDNDIPKVDSPPIPTQPPLMVRRSNSTDQHNLSQSRRNSYAWTWLFKILIIRMVGGCLKN